MRKIGLLLLGLLLAVITVSPFAHASLEDGTYNIDFELFEGESGDSLDIAEFFVKPAVLKVDGSDKHIQMMLKHASLFQSIDVENEEVSVEYDLEEEDIRLISFPIDKFDDVLLEMDIEFPSGKTEKNYQVRATFDIEDFMEQEEEEQEHNEAEENNISEESSITGSRSAENNHETNKDRKSTRLNSSHVAISYAVFCLKKTR